MYGNNTIVSIRDIGEGRRALLCITNEIGCCREANIPHSMRDWYFPNRSAVSIKNAGHRFYRDRNPYIVRLNRRYNATSPNGIFSCTIPSSITPLMTSTIHIGIYYTGQGNMFNHSLLSIQSVILIFLLSRNSSDYLIHF